MVATGQGMVMEKILFQGYKIKGILIQSREKCFFKRSQQNLEF